MLFRSGKTNTDMIRAQFGNSINYAARKCDELVYGGHSDWFMPSFSELAQVWSNLYIPGLDTFESAYGSTYMSSSESGGSYAASHYPVIYFDRTNFYSSGSMKQYNGRVRAIRAF